MLNELPLHPNRQSTRPVGGYFSCRCFCSLLEKTTPYLIAVCIVGQVLPAPLHCNAPSFRSVEVIQNPNLLWPQQRALALQTKSFPILQILHSLQSASISTTQYYYQWSSADLQHSVALGSGIRLQLWKAWFSQLSCIMHYGIRAKPLKAQPCESLCLLIWCWLPDSN